MKLIVGLGNPEEKYGKTRHNAGFIILDELRQAIKASNFKMEKKFNAAISEGDLQGEKILLVKPLTFMNRSGQSVNELLNFYKLSPDQVILIHDDLDIELGAFKISSDSSAAGHNGVQSVFDKLGTQQLKRIRIGIEGSEKKKERLISGGDFVLQNFSEPELATIKKLIPEIAIRLSN